MVGRVTAPVSTYCVRMESCTTTSIRELHEVLGAQWKPSVASCLTSVIIIHTATVTEGGGANVRSTGVYEPAVSGGSISSFHLRILREMEDISMFSLQSAESPVMRPGLPWAPATACMLRPRASEGREEGPLLNM